MWTMMRTRHVIVVFTMSSRSLRRGALLGGGATLAGAMLAARVTRTMLTPSMAALLLTAERDCPLPLPRATGVVVGGGGGGGVGGGLLATLRVTVLCGEVASTSLVRSLLAALTAPGAKLANLYSTSEAHDVALEPDLGAALASPASADVASFPQSAPPSSSPSRDMSRSRVIPCGVPYAHVDVLLLDDDGARAVTTPDTPGWLHIGGVAGQLAAGYLGRSGVVPTRRSFSSRAKGAHVRSAVDKSGGTDAPAPASIHLGGAWYATGDRALLRRDGRLVLLGRGGGASQAKVRGKLVDLAGAEDALRSHPDVADCACVARPLAARAAAGDTPNAENVVIAFVVPAVSSGGSSFTSCTSVIAPHGTGSVHEREEASQAGRVVVTAVGTFETRGEEIRAWLAERLPPAAVPSRLIGVSSLPLTAAVGSSAPKCDRQALSVVPLPLPSPPPRPSRRDGNEEQAGTRYDGEDEKMREGSDHLLLTHVVALVAKELGLISGRDHDTGAESVFGADSSFAAMGGASLAAQRLLTALRRSGTRTHCGDDTLVPSHHPRRHVPLHPRASTRWDLLTPADLMAADTPRRMLRAAELKTVAAQPTVWAGEGVGAGDDASPPPRGALSTREMFEAAMSEAANLGIGMWDHEGVWRGEAMMNSDRPEDEDNEDDNVEDLINVREKDEGGDMFKLDSSLSSLSLSSSPIRSARGVFLTGATGLLGRRLMRELLARMSPHAVLICLVRAESDAAAVLRLAAAQEYDAGYSDFFSEQGREDEGGDGGRREESDKNRGEAAAGGGGRRRINEGAAGSCGGGNKRSEPTALPDAPAPAPTPPRSLVDPRVRVIAGDAAAPLMGLSEAAHARLSEDVDLIIHSAGRVSSVAPYSAMARSNVAPAVEAVRLALRRPGRIALHHVSTSAALPPTGTPPAGESGEDDASWGATSRWSRSMPPFGYGSVSVSSASSASSGDDDTSNGRSYGWCESATSGGAALASLARQGGYDTSSAHGGTYQGYAQAKWVAEMVVWAAAASKGVPVVVHRPGNIGPCSATAGGCMNDATLALVWGTCVGIREAATRCTGSTAVDGDGAAPSSRRAVVPRAWRLWWTPADAAARAMATVAERPRRRWNRRALHLDPGSRGDTLPAAVLVQLMMEAMDEQDDVGCANKHLDVTTPAASCTSDCGTGLTSPGAGVGASSAGLEGGDEVTRWRKTLETVLRSDIHGAGGCSGMLPATVRNKLESILAAPSGLEGAMGLCERRVSTRVMRKLLLLGDRHGGESLPGPRYEDREKPRRKDTEADTLGWLRASKSVLRRYAHVMAAEAAVRV